MRPLIASLLAGLGFGALVLLGLPAAAGGAAAAAPIDPPVRIGILGDRTGSQVPGVHEGIVAELSRLRPDLVLNVGDMIEGYSTDSLALEAMWAEYDSIVAPLGPILHRTPGNHDITSDAAEPVYRHRNGPPNQAFDYGGVHVVTLDSSRWDRYEQIPPEQLAWLTDDLQRSAGAACTIVCMHKPVWFRGIAAGQPDPLHALFVRTGVDAVFTGHYHQYLSGAYDGIRYTSVGSSGGATDPGVVGPMYHFTWVTLDRDGIHVAPIDAGSVRPWSEVTAAEYHALEDRINTGLRFPEPFRVPADLGPSTWRVSLVVDNADSAVAIDDTLRWTVPSGWTIDPATLPVHVDPSASQVLRFQVARQGSLYPVPTAELAFPYAAGKTFAVQKGLAVARTADAFRGTPVIDARIDEPCWRDPVQRFFGPDGGSAMIDPIQVYFAHDGQNVYVAAVCHDPRIDSLRTTATERDGAVYNDDCVGFFIEPMFRSGTAYQIYVNPLGTVFDQKLERQAGGSYSGDRTWNGEYEVRTQRSPFAWIVEMRIPIAQFATRIGKNQPWRLNFRRKQPRLGTSGDWQVPIDYDPATFGFLQFR
jgi:predicted phosphodiesterase